MSDLFIPTAQTALDLTIKGSIGDFEVVAKSTSDRTSIPVKYLSGHIGLATNGNHEEKLLSRLAPVREVFNIKDLDLDQIMQRDIDDERVSNELIPYLLDEEASRGLVKFFPPIIIAVLATDKRGNPANYYPPVEESEADTTQPGTSWVSLRSGPIGNEAFEFRQLKNSDGQINPHDYAELRLNTQKCKLAIIDGQHRAMALVALYRNLKGWPEKTAQYKDYYRRWSPSKIESYDFSNTRIPIVFCIFPSLDEPDSERKLTIPEACRAVFLALNKNAKKVTEARNHLLDDNDLIAAFLRNLLGKIKSADATSAMALRIWNVELDSESDKTAVSNAMALTGVMHIFGLLEHLMLREDVIIGIRSKRSNTWKLTRLDGVWRRLEAKDELGEDTLEISRRHNLDRETEQKLVRLFSATYGKWILRCFDEFSPFRVHNTATLAREQKLRNGTTAAFHSLLFDGQSQARIFRRYIERMKSLRDEYKETQQPIPPEINEVLVDFEEKNRSLGKEIEIFYSERAARFLAGAPAWLRKHEGLQGIVTNDLYRNNFTTAAFQAGLIIAFFSIIEAVDDKLQRDGDDPLPADRKTSLLSEYLEAINAFFCPTTEAGLKNVLKVLIGEPTFDQGSEHVSVAPSRTLRRILVPAELNPNEWARMRYIFLELWSTSDEHTSTVIEADVETCRQQVYDRFVSHTRQEYAIEHGIQEAKITDLAAKTIREQCVREFRIALKPLIGRKADSVGFFSDAEG